MNSRHVLVVLVLSSVATSLQAQTPPAAQGSNFRDTVKITDVQVLTQRVNQPQQVCNQVPVSQTQTQQTPPPKHGMGGALIGSVAGGLIGHTVGEGKGKDAATLGGALVGAAVGNSLQNQPSPAGTTTTTVTTTQTVNHCYLVDNWVERQTGAIVSYSWLGRGYTETLPYVPAYRAGDDVQLQVHATLGGRTQG